MHGTWFIAGARRLVHQDTFEQMLAPAVADLQFEAGDGQWAVTLAAYLGVLRALAGAVCCDLIGDVRILSRDAGSLLRLIFLQSLYYSCLAGLIAGHGPVSLGRAVLLVVLIIGLSLVFTLFRFWPARSPAPKGTR